MPRSHLHVYKSHPIKATYGNVRENGVGRGYLVAITGSTLLLQVYVTVTGSTTRSFGQNKFNLRGS